MRKQWVIGLGAAVAVAIAVAVALGVVRPGGGVGQAAAAAAASAPLQFRPDEVLHPVLATLPQTVAFSGPLVAPNTAVLRAKASGTLVSLSVAEGARVAAGQPLGRIELAELPSRINERSAQLEANRAALAEAQRTQTNNERLAAQEFISPNALASSRAAVDAARANLQAAQAALDTTRVAQRDGQLLAPIAGIVAKRHALPGEKLAIEQPVLTVVNLRGLELAGAVGTHEVAKLAPGMAVQLRVEGLDAPLDATLSRIAPAAEAGTRSIGVTVALPNSDERLRAGQYAVAEVLLPDPQQRLVLPATAIVSTAGQPQVWLIDKGKLLRRAVTLGRRDEATGRVEVLTGLTPAAQVLAARFDNLREGLPALVQTSPAAAAVVASASASAQVRR
jgi:RND family efflux transporter MFP subunit